MKIIGLAYKKGVGKDTLGNFLHAQLRCEHAGLNVKRVSFAAKLKDICHQLYGWAGMKRGVYYETRRDHKETVLPLIGKSPRQIWIEVGNKMREAHPTTWIDYALHGIEADIIIITDVRFTNEAKAIFDIHNSVEKGMGFLIKINRDGPKGTDPAEIELDEWEDWDLIIDNNGTLRELNEKGVQFLKDFI